MEIPLSPDLERRLMRIAGEQGRTSSMLVSEAIERFVSHDEWFVSEVEVGLAAADRGEFMTAEEVRHLIDRRYPA
jgi:predicted transcriptional regulator